MFIPTTTLITIILFAYMFGMLTAFFVVVNAMLRFKK